jgi:hypothetical protein
MKIEELKILHNDILFGRKRIEDQTDDCILEVGKPKVFPSFLSGRIYRPDFDVFRICLREIERRRKERLDNAPGLKQDLV